MAFIDKLINKFNKVKQAVNSLKGIQSKIQAINYTTAIDALGEEKKAAEDLLDARRTSLEKSIGSRNQGQEYACKAPAVEGMSAIYPTYDTLSNYLVFLSRPRRQRGGTTHPVHTRRQVALYVPDALISQSSVTFNADTVNPMARALDDAVNAFKNAGEGDGFKAMAPHANKVATKFVQQTLNTLTGGLSNLKEGRAVNPMQEQMLGGIPFRSWDFTFDFWPKSKDEAQNVRDIIYIFRSSMLPDAYSELTSVDWTPGDNIGGPDDDAAIETKDVTKEVEVNASYFNYPNIFEISFDGPLGNNIDGFLPAVCTNAQVDYTGGQKFSTFSDGQPVHIQLTLNFLEIKTMTLGNYEAIRQGGSGTLDDMSVVDRQSLANPDMSEKNTGTG
jgi:hypothetical protein